MKAQLSYVENGQEVTIPLGEMTVIGRAVDADVQLNDRSASKKHAIVQKTGAGFKVNDLGSKNGTLVNGAPTSEAELQSGDTVQIGGYKLLFRILHDTENLVITNLDGENTIILDEFDLKGQETVTWLQEGEAQDSLPDTLAALRQRLDILQRLCELTAISDDFARIGLESVKELMSAYSQANRCCLLVFEGEPAELKIVHQELKDLPNPGMPSRTVCKRAVSESKCVLSRNTTIDPRFDASRSLAEIGAKSVMCAPLKGADRVHGLLYLETTSATRPFGTEDLRLLATVAADVAIGLENARLREERLKMERLAAIGQAIASMAHCIKNVLNTINCGSFIVNKGLDKQNWATVRKGWALMGNSNDFLRRMVLDMLAYSKPRKPTYEEQSLNGLLKGVCESSQMLAETSSVALVFDPLEPDPKAMLDATAMQRCLYNLITNAVEASANREGGGGQVTVSVAPSEETFRIVVADNGCGMPPEVREKLFQAFFSTKGSKGTGLGLPVVAKTVEEHKGTVEVESEVGKGTRFILTLPYRSPERATLATE